MDADDSNDKVRRNIVVFSSAIMLGAYLQLSQQAVLKRIFGDEFLGVSPLRVWVVLAIVLAYLWFRYRYSPAGIAAVEMAGAESRGFYQSVVNDAFQVKLQGVVKDYKNSPAEWHNLPEKISAQLTQLSTASVSWIDPPNMTAITFAGLYPRQLFVNVDQQAARAGSGLFIQQFQCPVEPPFRQWLSIAIRAAWRVGLHSDSFGQFFVPRLTALIAALIVATRLVSNVWISP